MRFLNYIQIALIILVVCVITSKALYSWSATGVFPIVIGRGKGAWRIIELLAFLSLMLWVLEVLLRALQTRFDLFPDAVGLAVLHTPPAKLIGAALLLIGVPIFIFAFLNFGTSWRIGIDRKTPGVLVTGGIFAITRNPIYVAFEIFFFAIFLMNGTWFFLIFALLAVVAIHFQILREEEFLQKQYGADFEKYAARTARYLIW